MNESRTGRFGFFAYLGCVCRVAGFVGGVI